MDVLAKSLGNELLERFSKSPLDISDSEPIEAPDTHPVAHDLSTEGCVVVPSAADLIARGQQLWPVFGFYGGEVYHIPS